MMDKLRTAPLPLRRKLLLTALAEGRLSSL